MFSGIEATSQVSQQQIVQRVERPKPEEMHQASEVVAKRISSQAKAEAIQDVQAEETAVSLEEVNINMQELAQRISEGVRAFSDKIDLTYDSTLERMLVSVTDGVTGEVVRQIPSDEMVEFMHKMRQTIENMLTEKEADFLA